MADLRKSVAQATMQLYSSCGLALCHSLRVMSCHCGRGRVSHAFCCCTGARHLRQREV